MKNVCHNFLFSLCFPFQIIFPSSCVAAVHEIITHQLVDLLGSFVKRKYITKMKRRPAVLLYLFFSFPLLLLSKRFNEQNASRPESTQNFAFKYIDIAYIYKSNWPRVRIQTGGHFDSRMSLRIFDWSHHGKRTMLWAHSNKTLRPKKNNVKPYTGRYVFGANQNKYKRVDELVSNTWPNAKCEMRNGNV